MASGYEGIILDVDGTLVDSNRFHARAWSRAFKENYFNVPEEQVRKLIGMGGDQIVSRMIVVSDESPVGRKICERKKEIFMTEYLQLVRKFPKSRALVLKMKRSGYRITVGSSADPEELTGLLKIAQVDDLLPIPNPGNRGRSKPAPDIMRRALEDLGLPPYKVVMLGDTPYDIEAGGRAGVSTVAFRCGGWEDEALRGAIALYDDPEDLWLRYQSSPLGPLAKFTHQEVS